MKKKRDSGDEAMKDRLFTLDVEDKGGAIFAAGRARFETVRKARPELEAGRTVRVRQKADGAFSRAVDRGEWMVVSATPIYRNGEPDGRVVLVLRRLAEDWGPRLGHAATTGRARPSQFRW